MNVCNRKYLCKHQFSKVLLSWFCSIKIKRLFFKCDKYLDSNVSPWSWIGLKALNASVFKSLFQSSHTEIIRRHVVPCLLNLGNQDRTESQLLGYVRSNWPTLGHAKFNLWWENLNCLDGLMQICRFCFLIKSVFYENTYWSVILYVFHTAQTLHQDFHLILYIKTGLAIISN